MQDEEAKNSFEGVWRAHKHLFLRICAWPQCSFLSKHSYNVCCKPCPSLLLLCLLEENVLCVLFYWFSLLFPVTQILERKFRRVDKCDRRSIMDHRLRHECVSHRLIIMAARTGNRRAPGNDAGQARDDDAPHGSIVACLVTARGGGGEGLLGAQRQRPSILLFLTP